MIEKITVQLTVLQGSGLVAKDRNMLGKKTASDPYVEVWTVGGRHKVGRTVTKNKTISPVWNDNQPFAFELGGGDIQRQNCSFVNLKIFDQDLLTKSDLMGVVRVPISTSNSGDTTEWYDVPPDSAKNASGRLQVRIQTTVHRSRSLVRGNAFDLTCNQIKVGLAWDMVQGGTQNVDLDASCVAITHEGKVAMPDTVYYANTVNSNESVLHSGDEQEGDAVGDDETITFHLDRIPSHVLAMYIVLTVATPGMQIADIQSTTVRVYDASRTQQRNNKVALCSFTPAQSAWQSQNDATAMYMVRIARIALRSKTWAVSPIEDTHPTARDFGSLAPQLKGYTRDLLPDLQIDPAERVAILRKGETIRLLDYCPGRKLPDLVTFGLAWDVTQGVNIDLDASAICLDSDMKLVDQVWWRQLKSQDGSMRHHGDEREGDEGGDDEKMDLSLAGVSESVQYIGFVINSYSGQELDDVARASCHLFDPKTKLDMVSYALTDARCLNGYTALVVACLYRGPTAGGWNLCIVSEAAQGKLVKDNVDELQNYLRQHPPQVISAEDEEEEIVVDNFMPNHVPLVDEEIDLSAPLLS